MSPSSSTRSIGGALVVVAGVAMLGSCFLDPVALHVSTTPAQPLIPVRSPAALRQTVSARSSRQDATQKSPSQPPSPAAGPDARPAASPHPSPLLTLLWVCVAGMGAALMLRRRSVQAIHLLAAAGQDGKGNASEEAASSPTPTPPPAPTAPLPKIFEFLDNSPLRIGLRLGWEARNWIRKQISRFSRPMLRDFADDAEEDEMDGLGCTVAVVGALTPVGRVLIRKLLLRGYTIRVILLPTWEVEAGALPESQRVESVTVDLLDHAALVKAMRGVGKVVYCASQPGPVAFQDRLVLDDLGVRAVCRAIQDIRNVAAASGEARPGRTVAGTPAKRSIAKMKPYELWGDVQITQRQALNLPAKYASLAFQGAAYFTPSGPESPTRTAVFFGEFQANRDAVAEVALPVTGPVLSEMLAGEVLLLKCLGDNNRYTVALEVDGVPYTTAFTAVKRWQSVRLPLEAFRGPTGEPLPAAAQNGEGRLILGFGTARAVTAVSSTGRVGFRLEVQFIKVIPAVAEPDLVLVSLSSSSFAQGFDGQALVAVQERGEAAVRNAGLGYTIIRPATMQDIPSGNAPLQFDQARRGSAAISVADVADLCVKVLRIPAACNKAIDVSLAAGTAEGLSAALAAPVSDPRRVVQVLGQLDKHI